MLGWLFRRYRRLDMTPHPHTHAYPDLVQAYARLDAAKEGWKENDRALKRVSLDAVERATLPEGERGLTRSDRVWNAVNDAVSQFREDHRGP